MDVCVHTTVDCARPAAVVTGAGHPSGIGFGIAAELAACGMDVVIMDLPSSPLAQSRAALRENYGVRVLAVAADVASEEDVRRAVEEVRAFAPKVRALVNNAGVMPAGARVGDVPPEVWRRIMAVNLEGPLHLMRAFLPLFERGSSVINVASRAGKRPSPGYSPYSVSKAALIMLTKCFAVEYAAEGIRANAVCPGQIDTELNRVRFAREAAEQGLSAEERTARMVGTIPCGRMGTPEDVGRLVAFLASEESDYITGQALNVCGGQLTEV